MNIGFNESILQHNFDCFIFHDVDLLPEIDQNLYVCSKNSPRHFSAAVNTHGYKYVHYFCFIFYQPINFFAILLQGWSLLVRPLLFYLLVSWFPSEKSGRGGKKI